MGGDVLDEQATAVVRKCQLYLSCQTDPDLSAIPFTGSEVMSKFFQSQGRIVKLSQLVLLTIPYDTHFPLALVHLTIAESFRLRVFMDGKKTGK